MKLHPFPAFFLGMAVTAAIALGSFGTRTNCLNEQPSLEDLVDVSEWKFTERQTIPGQTGMTVQYFQDVANGICYARFSHQNEVSQRTTSSVTWIPCEATNR